jgi:hypothetical protein
MSDDWYHEEVPEEVPEEAVEEIPIERVPIPGDNPPLHTRGDGSDATVARPARGKGEPHFGRLEDQKPR